MKLASKIVTLVIWLATISAQAQIPRFEHIIVIVQENRTPDNLFQGLCSPPYGSKALCNTKPDTSHYNIQVSGWLNNKSATGTTEPGSISLAAKYDLGHSHPDFVTMCDLQGRSMQNGWRRRSLLQTRKELS